MKPLTSLFSYPINTKPNKERPDYYITPTRDFTRHTRDCEEKYWSKDTAFNWNQSVEENLKCNLEALDSTAFSTIAFLTLPMINETLEKRIRQLQQEELPAEEDALKSIGECMSVDSTAIEAAIAILQPLKHLQIAAGQLKDQLTLLQTELSDLQEQQRLGFFKTGILVKHRETTAESDEQAKQIAELTRQITPLQAQYQQVVAQCNTEWTTCQTTIREKLRAIQPEVLADLQASQALVQEVLSTTLLPDDPFDLNWLKDLIFKRQLRGLKDIANHALVVEQSAIAPLTMGIIHYKRHREIQEAMTTFINDEAKHSATFRRYLAEKLQAREYIPAKLINGANRYMWLARFMPGVGLFFAVVVEAIGAAVLEFFGNEKYMPDKLFCSICKTISDQDETRHLNLCVDMYNELFRKGRKWELVQNNLALRIMMKSVYGDKTEDHHLIQAFRAFGVDSATMYRHIFGRVSEQLARIGMYMEPEKLLRIIGRS